MKKFLVVWMGSMLLTQAVMAGTGPFNLDLPDYAVTDRVSLRDEVPANTKYVVAELDGPGCINHIWMTLTKPNTVHPRYGSISDKPRAVMPNRKMILRIYFDDAERPHIEAPVGDFFGMMHGEDWYPINTEFLSALPWSGYNSYFQMPFAKKARLELETSDEKLTFYTQIDWHRYPGQEMKEQRRFCAAWRRENPTQRYGEDYFMLDVEGPGQLVGFVYGVRLFDNVDRWSHGGAENIYIDGLGAHPAFIRGIGGEDTFGTSYGGAVHEPTTHLYSSQPYYVHQDIGEARPAQRLVGYRFFVKDAVQWHQSLHMRFGTMENEICSTVYWYQPGPVRSGTKLPTFKEMLPNLQLARERTIAELPDSGSWKVGGPFENANNIAIAQALKGAFVPEVADDSSWIANRKAYHGFIDFNHLWRPHQRGVGIHYKQHAAVAQSILTVDRDMTCSIQVAWDDHLIMQVNDAAPLDMGNQSMFRTKTVTVPLKKGDNRITLTLSNTTGLNHGGWAFAFKSTDPDGQVLVPKSR